MSIELSLDQHRRNFASRRFLTVPLAGALCWLVAGVINLFVSPFVAAWTLFIATGSIVYVAMALSKITGEDFFNRKQPKNPFDNLFLRSIIMALMVYAIAIPFFIKDYTSLPLTVGILTGLMWMPFSWIIQHWAGTFHAVSRTLLILAAWYLFPQQAFVLIPAVIVGVYVVTIIALERRWHALNYIAAKGEVVATA